MAASIILHERKKIIFDDYTWCLSRQDNIDQLEDYRRFLQQFPDDAELLILKDVSGASASPKLMKLIHEYYPILRPKIKKHAIIGLTSIKMMLLRNVNKLTGEEITPFKTKEEALAWLTMGDEVNTSSSLISDKTLV